MKASYNCSPFFEFFEDDLQHIYSKKYRFLNDLNFDAFLFLTDALQLEIKTKETTEYEQHNGENDFRFLANVKQNTLKNYSPYIQVFSDKHGFLPNLSMLDLLFMEGPNAVSYL